MGVTIVRLWTAEPRRSAIPIIPSMNADVAEVHDRLARHRVLTLRENRHLRGALYRLVERGELAIIYPGVFVRPGDLGDVDVRIFAACRWKPDAVLVGRAAARMSFWRDLAVPVVEMASPRRQRDRHRMVFAYREVPGEWRMRFRGVWLSRPALTVLDLVPALGGAVISQGLRCGVEMDQLWSAWSAQPHRPGQSERRRLLRAYRHLPWSEAEQVLHVLLRGARLRGWIANYPMTVEGAQRYLDVVFEEQRVVIEVDGFEFHGYATAARQRFEDDREVADWLVVHDWRVLRFTWRQPERATGVGDRDRAGGTARTIVTLIAVFGGGGAPKAPVDVTIVQPPEYVIGPARCCGRSRNRSLGGTRDHPAPAGRTGSRAHHRRGAPLQPTPDHPRRGHGRAEAAQERQGAGGRSRRAGQPGAALPRRRRGGDPGHRRVRHRGRVPTCSVRSSTASPTSAGRRRCPRASRWPRSIRWST